MPTITIRRAVDTDGAILAEFNRAIAWETEHKTLDEDVVRRGVLTALQDPTKGFYLVAELEGAVVGQLMVTTEWSDWRNGWFWWIQSVYVHPKARQQGVFRQLYAEVKRLALERSDVVGLRLYVERDNESAQRTYQRLGMHDAGYLVYEMAIPKSTGSAE